MANLGASMIEKAIEQGRAYRLSVFTQTLSLGGVLKLLITNPANSGKRIIIVSSRTISGANVASRMRVYRLPTGGLPTQTIQAAGIGGITNLTTNPAYSGNATVLQVLASSGALLAGDFTGGTMTRDLPVNPFDTVDTDTYNVQIYPGVSVGISWGATGIASVLSYENNFTQEDL